MIRQKMIRHWTVALASLILAVGRLCAAETRDNPNYGVWAKFKPGSSSTVAADIPDGHGSNVHVETTRTLVSVTDDKVVVKKVSVATQQGHVTTQQPETETILARTDKDEIKESGQKEIDAMGKTFKCRVWDSTISKPAPAGTGKPVTAEQIKASIYVSDQVPGGVVRLDGVTRTGRNFTFILTKFDAK